MEKPSDMPQQEYISLTPEQKRNLPDHRDGFITVEGHPKLTARYNQVIFKTPKHGKIHGLPTDENGKTPKTEKNALALRDSLVKMTEREGILWFDNGGYQKGTERGYDSVNIYDQENRVIAVFKKQEDGKYSQFENLNPNAPLPESPDNILGLIDNFDVPISEKPLMEGAIINGSKNDTNLIFINNNNTNI